MPRPVALDAASMTDGRRFHQTLARALRFPAYYGANLDALTDCLTDLAEREEVDLILTSAEVLAPDLDLALQESVTEVNARFAAPRLRLIRR